MERVVTCPGCGVLGKLPADYPAGQISCPQCHTVFAIPEVGIADDFAELEPARLADEQFAVWVGEPGEKAPTTKPALGGVSGPAPEDAVAHLDWLRQETQQFNQYVASRLAVLDRRRQELATLESRLESEFTTREQELSRQRAALTARTEVLANREAEIARREGAFTDTVNGLESRESSISAREAKLHTIQLKVAELERREKQLWPTVEALERRKEEAEHLLTRLSELDKRQAELEREGQALTRRTAELDELEHDLRQELEQREQEVEKRSLSLDQREKQLRAAATAHETPAPMTHQTRTVADEPTIPTPPSSRPD